ncbi:MAG: hypothetical protein ABSH14_01080 [Verrucomicrobiia bacterium]
MRLRLTTGSSLCACAIVGLSAIVVPRCSQAQTNSWTYLSGGYWDEFRNWSLGVRPASSQVVLITNAPTKLVTADSYTSSNYPASLTITSLTLSADQGITNTLSLSNAGTTTPLYIQDSLAILSGGVLLMTNSSLQVGGPAGGSFVLEGAAAISGTNSFSGGVYIGLSTNSSGSLFVVDGQSVFTNGYTVIGFYGSGQAVLANGTLQTGDDRSLPNGVFLGLSSGSQGVLSIAGGTCVAPEHLSLGDSAGSTGAVWITGGQLILTNNYLTTVGDAGAGQLAISNGQLAASSMIVANGPGSLGAFTVAGGTVTLSGGLVVGDGLGATGAVFITGGQLVVTNQNMVVGSYGVAQMAVSNGVLLAQAVNVGNSTGSVGMLTIAGGATAVASNIVAGVFSNANAVIQITGGSLTVTNQSATGQLVVGQTGQATFSQSGGVSTVDQLLVTNGTNSVFNFSSGVFNTQSTTVSNTQTFAVGDGTGAAIYHLLGGVHSFADGLRIRNNSVLSGCGTITGSVLVDAGGTVLADCGGTLTFTDIVTNNGSWKAVNGSVLESYGPVVNNGLMNVLDGHTNFLAGFVNNGVVLDSNSLPRIVSVSLVGPDVGISFTTVSNFTHVVEFTGDLVSQGWAPLFSFTGSGGLTNVTDPGVAVLTQRFYRVRLVVPQ